ncbi:MAG: hypothetical protein ACP5II_02440 [Infirmifilum sp.]|uniref:Uncharacterized protein n=1 Tax=Infirmifilum uzonense TaxID=1550241 RepID=A0A0F7FIK9_9CREN|nr:hypothetical protein [Infirmifilum uzonense]AKG38650.1 hypothetical protein MA03_04230 [Infirmifilum uzonense]
MTQGKAFKRGVTWAHIVTFILATAMAYVLAVLSSLIFPVLGAPGVSALYVASSVYVPLGIWMGGWGALAGYLSCLFLGLYPSGYTLYQSVIWAFADFIEAFIPALLFRILRIDPDFTVKRGAAARLFPVFVSTGFIILILGIIIQVLLGSLGEPFTSIYVASVYTGLGLAVIGIMLGLLVGDAKTWGVYIASIILTSVASGIWGAATLTLYNVPPPLPAELFWPIFTGWVIGDFIVLSVLSTGILTALTPIFKRTGLYVEGWWA